MSPTDLQLALPLLLGAGRGGRRPGAGRKPGPSPRIPHLRRSAFSRCTPCHVTLRARREVPSLRSARLVRELERSFAQACEREEFRVAHYSVQRDHLHLIVEATTPAALGRGMKSIAARVARAANRIFGRRGPVLADRYHHRLLRTPREVRHAIAYVLHNARKHAAQLGRALVAAAGVDPASSGRWFTDWTHPLVAPVAAPAVSPARSWLLRIGWLRHGRIALDEIPGERRRGLGRR